MLIQVFHDVVLDHSLIFEIRQKIVDLPEPEKKREQPKTQSVKIKKTPWNKKARLEQEEKEKEESARQALELLENKPAPALPQTKEYGVEVHYWTDKNGSSSSSIYNMLDKTRPTAVTHIDHLTKLINKYNAAAKRKPKRKKVNVGTNLP
jgi:methylthioribose-1-phosphate isomerase